MTKQKCIICQQSYQTRNCFTYDPPGGWYVPICNKCLKMIPSTKSIIRNKRVTSHAVNKVMELLKVK